MSGPFIRELRLRDGAARWAVGLALLGSWVGTATADLPSGAMSCRDIADPTSRLACFDRAAGVGSQPAPAGPREGVTGAPAPAVAAPVMPAASPGVPAPPAPVLNAQQQFGLPEHALVAKEVAAGTRAADVSKVESRVRLLARAPDQRMVFTLENGQVWRQLLIDGDLLAKQGDSVTISRGVFHSYWLQLPSGRGCKVTRLR